MLTQRGLKVHFILGSRMRHIWRMIVYHIAQEEEEIRLVNFKAVSTTGGTREVHSFSHLPCF